MRQKLLIALLLIVAGLTLTLIGRQVLGPKPKEALITDSLQIVLTTPDASNVTATLNDKPFTISSVTTTKSLALGNYKLSLNKLGYTSFSVSFSLHENQPVTITVPLERTSIPTLNAIPPTTNPDGSTDNWTITNVSYFYSNTWAFAATTDNTDSIISYFVMHYNDATQSWETVLGPDSIFDPGSVAKLPSAVQNYLNDNNYVNAGD